MAKSSRSRRFATPAASSIKSSPRAQPSSRRTQRYKTQPTTLRSFTAGFRRRSATGKVSAEEVIGIGIDFTCCTVLPVTEDGVPLCQLDQWRDHADAWVKLVEASLRPADR